MATRNVCRNNREEEFSLRVWLLLVPSTLLAASCTRGVLLNPDNAMSPQIISIVPSSGAPAGGTKIAIHGAGFVNGGNVKLGSTVCADVEWISSSQVNCTTPASQPGAVNVALSNPNQLISTLTNGFVYTDGAPAVPGQALVAGGSVSLKASDRSGTVTVGEVGSPVLQSGSDRVVMVGIQAVLSAGN